MPARYDAIVVGSGPNGLTAAVVLARAGYSVLVLESQDTIGGGARTAALTLPGFLHDVCSAIHPTAVVSPIFRQLELERLGVEWVEAPAELAHPLDDGQAALLTRSPEDTAGTLGEDGERWRALVEPFLRHGTALFDDLLRPIFLPRHPLRMLRFGTVAVRSCAAVIDDRFRAPRARALFAGCAAHSVLPLDVAGTASFGLVLALAAHAAGWPLARGGSSAIANALARDLLAHGGEIRTSAQVRALRELPPSRVVLLDLVPRNIAAIAADALPASYLRRLLRFRHGPGVFKLDWALDGPIPWTARACGTAATVHVGGTYEEIARSESDVAEGKHPERPFVLVAQPSLFDRSRVPAPGKETGWAYCHVPNGSTVDMTDRIERQIERFAPGFRDRILARHAMSCAAIEAHNANMVGGDIAGGANDLLQFLFRPVARLRPHTTPNPRIFICSSSTPPGGGVHGMCGYWAARGALRRLARNPDG